MLAKSLILDYEREFVAQGLADFRLCISIEVFFNFQEFDS